MSGDQLDASRDRSASPSIMNAVCPFIRHDRLDAIVAIRKGQPVSAARFLHDAAALAALLPARRNVLNLCADRYRFTVGLAAALSRQQISLLPPNDTPGMLGEIATDYPD